MKAVFRGKLGVLGGEIDKSRKLLKIKGSKEKAQGYRVAKGTFPQNKGLGAAERYKEVLHLKREEESPGGIGNQ